MANCEYHPIKQAVTICERCGRAVCLEDKRIHRIRRNVGIGSTRSYHREKYDLCPICQADVEIAGLTSQAGKKLMRGYVSVFLFIVLGVVVSMNSLVKIDDIFNSLIWIAVPFLVIFLLIPILMISRLKRSVNNDPVKVVQLRLERSEFLNSLDTIPIGLENDLVYTDERGIL